MTIDLSAFLKQDRWKKQSLWRDYIRDKTAKVQAEVSWCGHGNGRCTHRWVYMFRIIVKDEFVDP